MRNMNHYRRLQLLLVMFLTATFGMAQTDSTKVQNDSITWNKELEGVTVKAQRQLIKQDIDRIGYDVQADEESKTQTVLDISRLLPTLEHVRMPRASMPSLTSS